MAQVNDTPLEEVMELFFLCGYEMQRTAATEWESLELTAAQLKVLFTLAFENQATIGTVAHTLRISPPTASHLVERLVQAGLVERVESTRDRRSTLARRADARAAESGSEKPGAVTYGSASGNQQAASRER